MSESVQDGLTLSPTTITEQSPQVQAPSNHHASPSPPTSEVRGKRVPPRRGSVDRDAQELVITSLRTQVQDLVSQVTELNNKLVKSYDRVSDLEDDLHVTSSALRTSSVKISELELERSQHLSALNTGLLVEKSHVTAELTRLMEKATEEAARRGQAESARADIEKDLDDVSAALFDQANTMVAEARLGRAQSERKAEEAERALREAEDAVRLMQQGLQALQGEKEAAERTMEGMSAAMGKGNWIERVSSSPADGHRHRLLTSHVAYQEYISLLSHLRALRATQPQPPTISSLLGLPFIARLQLEDTDPTTRLDAAPSLNWLTRRSFVAAIQTGQLTIEPIATQTILASATSPQPPLAVTVLHGSSNVNLLSCGLCGHGIVPHTESNPSRTGYLSRANLNGTQFNTWSSSIFRKSPVTPSHSEPPSPPPYYDTSSLPAQLYIFRLSEPTPASPSALPLCVSGWCLARLRATCSLWSFLRISILEKIWEEEPQTPLPPPRQEIEGANVDKPPVPPRRKGKGSGFWGVASSFGLDRVPLAGWGESEKSKRTEPEPETRRFVAPPLRSNPPGPSSLAPPPLPSRNRSRKRKPVPTESEMEGGRSSGAESSARESQSSVSDSHESPTQAKPEVSPILSSLLVSSPVETDTLDDGFLTPPEDVAPAEIALTPAPVSVSVPQLELSHDTPVAKAAPLPDDTSKESEAPPPESKPVEPVPTHRKQRSSTSDHIDMRPHSPAPNTESPVSPPSRTGSPFAPPLPRRAAARRAVPPPPPAAPSAPSAPGPGPAADARPAKEAVVEQPNGHHVEPQRRTEPDAKPVVAPEPDSPPAPPPISEQPGDPQKEKEAVSGQPTAAETMAEGSVVPATSGAEATVVPVVVVDGIREEAEAEPRVDKPDETPERAALSGSGDGSAPHGDAAGGARAPPTRPLPPPRHPRPVPPPPPPSTTTTERRAVSDNVRTVLEKGAGKGKVELGEEHPGFAPDGTPFVGDGTWEERTWKELTRLREDMFLARMGGVQ